MADAAPTSRDYRETVFLPETPFPMRGGLPQKEPDILARWREMDLYRALRAARKAEGAPLFVLHDGPPYANGAIHIGHSLNKILKDFVVRSRFGLGFDVDYVPGWDCHGLPIEWKIEEEYRSKGRARTRCPRPSSANAAASTPTTGSAPSARSSCGWACWAPGTARYATMDFPTEAAIVAEFHKGSCPASSYRGSKPVMWSPVERTALADAEVEYHDHVSPHYLGQVPGGRRGRLPSTAARGRRPHRDASPTRPELSASVVIWTTTPWTPSPATRAIAYGPAIAYRPPTRSRPWRRDSSSSPGPARRAADPADKLAEDVRTARQDRALAPRVGGRSSALTCEHPLAAADPGYRYPVPLLPGGHVTEEAGHGLRPHRAFARRGGLSGLAVERPARRAPTWWTRTGPILARALVRGLMVLETEGQ
jgi:isoleucyl-tRNA synthetase